MSDDAANTWALVSQITISTMVSRLRKSIGLPTSALHVCAFRKKKKSAQSVQHGSIGRPDRSRDDTQTYQNIAEMEKPLICIECISMCKDLPINAS